MKQVPFPKVTTNVYIFKYSTFDKVQKLDSFKR